MNFLYSLKYLVLAYTKNMSVQALVFVTVVVWGITVVLNEMRKKKKSLAYLILCDIYLVVLISLTILGRKPRSVINNFPKSLFSSWIAFSEGIRPWKFYEIIYNVILFIPCGFIIQCECNEIKKSIKLCFCVL